MLKCPNGCDSTFYGTVMSEIALEVDANGKVLTIEHQEPENFLCSECDAIAVDMEE